MSFDPSGGIARIRKWNVRAKGKLVTPPPYMRNTTEVPITVAE